MPIYEYSCEKCKTTFSLLQRIGSSEKDTVCPKCGSGEVKKKFSVFGCSASRSISGVSSSVPGSGGS